jgi:2-oxoglutarate ferredoxin oxidoreductase subunit gamma
MGEVKQIILCGLGGQGIVLAGTMLGYAGINDGKWVAGSSAYGSQARGGYTRAEVVISDKPIVYPHVIDTDVLVAMSQSSYDNYIDLFKRENGIVLYDEQMVAIRETDHLKQIGIPATEIASTELDNKQVANMVILGAVVGITRMVTREALISAIEENVPQRFKALNVKAAELGLYWAGKEGD